MIEKYVRPRFQALFLDPLARLLSQVSLLTPLRITLAGLLFGLICALLIGLGHIVTALLFLGLSGLCDALDGTLARLQESASPVGTAFDIVCDRLVEAAVVMGLFFYAPDERALTSLLMMGSILLCITSFLVVGIFSENTSDKSFYYSPGIIERGEAFLFFVCMITFPSYFVLLSTLFSLLVCLTAFIRLVQFANIWKGR